MLTNINVNYIDPITKQKKSMPISLDLPVTSAAAGALLMKGLLAQLSEDISKQHFYPLQPSH